MLTRPHPYTITKMSKKDKQLRVEVNWYKLIGGIAGLIIGTIVVIKVFRAFN